MKLIFYRIITPAQHKKCSNLSSTLGIRSAIIKLIQQETLELQ